MVIRIQPADKAGDALRALAEAGAEESRLFGYDFTDYDALYQEAAEKAVTMARTKAEMIARTSGATLGGIESFSISRPARQGRFGPQPNVIRPANRYRGPSGSVVDRQTNKIKKNSPAAPAYSTFTCWDGSVVFGMEYCPPQPQPVMSMSANSSIGYDADDMVVVQEASTELVNVPPVYETVYEDGIQRRIVKTPASVKERVIPAIVKSRAELAQTTNALSMSLLSGPQTISATANLSYDYETPLDDKIIIEKVK